MIAVRMFAWRLLGLALAADGERLLSLEPGGRLLSVAPGEARPSEVGRLPPGAIDFQPVGDGLVALVEGGRLVETDRAGTRRGERPAPATRGLAVDGAGRLWLLDGNRLRLEGGDEAIELGASLGVARWQGERIVGTSIEGPRRSAPFRWRGLAPGAGPAPPGDGVRFALLDVDRTGRVVGRTPLAQEPVGLAVVGDARWVSSRAAEGLDRVAGPGA